MRNTYLLILLFVALIAKSCVNEKIKDENSEVNPVSEKKETSVKPNGNQKQAEKQSVNNRYEIRKQEQQEIKKVNPIEDLPSIIAKPLPGLEGKIDLLKIPTKQEVGITAYPNAFVIELDEKTEYKGKFYVSMELATPDSLEQVLAYYKAHNENWSSINNNGIHTFKKDADEYFRATNTLQILPINKVLYSDVDSLLGHNANTLIRIYYEIDTEGKVLEQLSLAYPAPVNR